ncbi:hypothetical protein [Caulobacter sp. DWR1-3-2b1]|uniref:hypothetical protein n=1 Tax=Caulobacter sp. DWR1-3-2b1 TaxID=2804670 RepID=UPI003CF6F034
MRSWLTGLMAVAVLAGASSALAGDEGNAKGERSLAKMVEGRVAGEPIDCIDPRRSLMIDVIDKTAIVIRMPAGIVYVNRPEMGVAALDHDSIINPRTNGVRLCRGDAVAMVDRGGKGSAGSRASVSLGQFVPYTKEK